MTEKTRLNKAMAMLGICSRRDADKLIEAKQVSVNNITVTELGYRISDGSEIVIAQTQNRYIFKQREIEDNTKVWLYYKPVGIITTHRDNSGRLTVFDDLKDKIDERVISVGRLDINSEGLLVLTNNGEFARHAESPRTAWERRYRVRIFGYLGNDIIKQLRDGVRINDIRYAPIIVKQIDTYHGRNSWIDCTLHEGKNREIRKVFGHFNIMVNKLIRYKYGPYELGALNPGDVVETPYIPLFRHITSVI
ncbi:MAG: rRNA pseudouridine synthase [Holosporales bacterium]|jgi:23S rRNA pseudouridine2605 synthase|nr:rRNA pseudouridine synthase [Holosporales bacterium]